MFLQHSFEMLLKAGILQKTGTIHERGERYTYGFDRCLTIAHEQLRVITRDDKMTLEILDVQRDQAVHFYADVSEDMLYVHAQSSVTLFTDLLSALFERDLTQELPSRILPVSTRPPRELQQLLWNELQEVDRLLEAGTRRGAHAAAKLRSVLAFTVGTREDGERVTESEIESAIQQRRNKREWAVILPEVVQLDLSAKGTGMPVFFTISKNASSGLRVAAPGEEVVGTLVKQEIDVWEVFTLSLADLASKLQQNRSRTLALIYELKIQEDRRLYKELKRKSQVHKGYSKRALDSLRTAVATVDMDVVGERNKGRVLGKKLRDLAR
jgi:hypothetical protein